MSAWENLEQHVAVQDRIEDNARQAWALSAFLLAYYNDGEEGRAPMTDEVMAGLMENLNERIGAIRDLSARKGAQATP